MTTSLALHGGAGALPRAAMTAERAREFHVALHEALRTGHAVLSGGGRSLDAVEAVVGWLEDCPLFNAGRGSAYTRDGTIEMEASIMDGASLSAGAAFLLRRVRNPVRLARAIMEKTGHVALAGEAAEAFARLNGLPLESAEYFHTAFRYEAMLKLRGTDRTALSEDAVVSARATEADKSGTVGAVALDRSGSLAAATSSGGTTNKMSGRIGQAAIVGAGVYANNRACAVSCTGHGEAFMRTNAAHEVASLILHRGFALDRAAQTVIAETLPAIRGRGGLIALDAAGNVSLPFNTEGMYRGWLAKDGRARTAIYGEITEWPAL